MTTHSFRHMRSLAVIAFATVLSSVSVAQTQTPIVGFVIPNSADAGGPAFTLNITGAGFSPGAAVYWSNQALPTTFVSANQLSATVGAPLIAVAGQIQISIANVTGARSNALTFTINAGVLTISATTLPQAQVGTAFSHTLIATGGAAPYTWNAVDALPPGLALNQAGQLTGTPTATGNYTFTVRVTDGAQRSATTVLPLSVAAPPFSISTAATLPPAMEGVEYSQRLEVTNGKTPLRWTTGAGLPPGITLDTTTGVLRGAPTTRGTFSFAVQVTDAANISANKTFTLVVQSAPLVITTVSPLFSGTVGSPYSQTFAAVGGTQPYAWTLTSPVPGLGLERNTGVLSGTSEQPGSYTVRVQVTDAAGVSTSKEFAFVVEQPQLRITTASPLPAGTVGTMYEQRLFATGGRLPYTWSIASGSIPGLLLDSSTGVLRETPSTSGTFNMTVQVRDAAGSVTSRVFAISIAPGALTLAPVTETLQSTVGNSFSLTLVASGGTPPYSWSANGLPDGVELNPATGELSGRPTAVGSFLFTVRVTDAFRATVTELYRWDIVAPTLPGLSAAGITDVTMAADQPAIALQTSSPYSLPLTGQLTLSFSPDSGAADPAVQFSTGGRTVDFQIRPGTTQAEFAGGSLGLQTGTVAGTITLAATLRTQGVLLTPTPVRVQTTRVERSAPVIRSASFTRTASAIEVRLTGYSTSREATQAVFRFQANGENPLAASEVTIPLDDAFGRWFRDSESTQYGGQFTFTQQFGIQGDANAVTPVSVTLTNRVGTTTANIR
jgi:hypothetical protein